MTLTSSSVVERDLPIVFVIIIILSKKQSEKSFHAGVSIVLYHQEWLADFSTIGWNHSFYLYG